MKCPWIHCSGKQRSESHTNCKPPAIRNTLSPGLTSSKQDPSVLVETEVTTFNEDYHQPAAPERCTTVEVDLQVVYLTDRFSHQQVIHILSYTAGTHHKRVGPGSFQMIRATKLLFHQVIPFIPKPVHPGNQAHLWFGSRKTSHPNIEGLLKGQSPHLTLY